MHVLLLFRIELLRFKMGTSVYEAISYWSGQIKRSGCLWWTILLLSSLLTGIMLLGRNLKKGATDYPKYLNWLWFFFCSKHLLLWLFWNNEESIVVSRRRTITLMELIGWHYIKCYKTKCTSTTSDWYAQQSLLENQF